MRLILLMLLLNNIAWSQELADTTYEKLYRNSYSGGIHFNTSGWGFYGEITKQKTFKYHHVLGFQVSNIHHKNEFKTSTITGGSSFFFYKLNSLVAFRPTVGGNLKLFQVRRENGIEIQFKWKIGPSIGLLKPIYLDIRTTDFNSGTRPLRYDPDNHGFSVIESRSNWFTGFGESTIRLGLHSKNGINFNFSKDKSGISGGEVGFMFDYYPIKDVIIMFEADNYSLFTGFYIQFELGNKF